MFHQEAHLIRNPGPEIQRRTGFWGWGRKFLVTMDDSLHGKLLLVVRKGGSTRFRIYKALKNLGIRLICFEETEDEACNAFFDSWILGKCDECRDVCIELITHELQIRGLCPDGVVTFDDYGVQLCSVLNAKLKLPGLPPQMVAVCQDKFCFRSYCRTNDIPCINYALLSTEDDVQRITDSMRFPVVMKPRRGAGSIMVRRVDSPDDLRTAFLWAQETLPSVSLPRIEDDHSILLAEEFIDGTEVDVDVVVRNGEPYYMEVVDNLPPISSRYFMEEGCRAPSLLPPTDVAALRTAAAKIIRCFSTTCSPAAINGVFHVEFRLGPNGPVPIEVNCRLGGAETRCMHAAVWGVDLGVEAALAALGLRSRLPPPLADITPPSRPPLRHAASINFVPAASGRLLRQVPARH
jgi:hypothetical protein